MRAGLLPLDTVKDGVKRSGNDAWLACRASLHRVCGASEVTLA